MLTTLQAYIEERKSEYDMERANTYPGSIAFAEETLIYCIQDWDSMMGGFTEEEYAYLEEAWGLTKYDVDFFVNHEFDTGCAKENEDDE